MSLSKTTILADAVRRTNRSDVTGIDGPLRAVLFDITGRFPFLRKVSQVTLGARGQSVALPSNAGLYQSCGSVDSVSVLSSGRVLEPIRDMAMFRGLVQCEVGYPGPTAWIRYGDSVLVTPRADAAIDLLIDHSYVSGDVDTILLPDAFGECLIEGVCYRIYESLGMGTEPAAQAHAAMYEKALQARAWSYGFLAEGPKS